MKKVSIIAFMILICGTINANNIQITNISVVPANKTIKFDITWENSWRSDVLNNWDAAYVFFKFYDPISKSWDPVYVNNLNNIIPAGFSATAQIANTGYFLYRSAIGSGTTTMTNVELGILPQYANGVYDIKAFAIEMVYIPTATFFMVMVFLQTDIIHP
jgi:hypothetical protein